LSPGPIQFSGPTANDISYTLKLELGALDAWNLDIACNDLVLLSFHPYARLVNYAGYDTLVLFPDLGF
jgi:hypothetical protein